MSRSTSRALALLAVLIAFYGSVVPLRLRDETSWAAATARLGALPFEPIRAFWTGDFIVNALVFLPIGFFAAGSFGPKSRPTRAVVVTTAALLCVCLAVAIEFSQLFVRDRTTSWSDVLGLSVGGLVGTLLWAAFDAGAADAFTAAFDAAAPARRVLWLVTPYSALWIVVGLLPLLFPPFAYPLPSSVWLRSIGQPSLVSSLASALQSALSVAPIGTALAMAAGRLASGWRVCAMMLFGVAAVLYVDRVRQVTPGVTTPDAAVRLIGLGLGLWLAWSGVGKGILSGGLRPGRWAVAALAGWCAVLVLLAWAPFDFGIDSARLDLRVRILYEREPLYRYYWAPPLMALNMALTQLLLAAPVGALLCLQTFRNGRSASIAVTILAATTFFAILEWGQLHLPGHRADPTDVMIGAAGAFIGAKLAQAVAASPPQPLADS